MVGARLANGLFPFGGKASPPIAVSGLLEIQERGVVIFALVGIDDAHRLGAPKPGGKVRMQSPQSLRRRLGGIELTQSAQIGRCIPSLLVLGKASHPHVWRPFVFHSKGCSE